MRPIAELASHGLTWTQPHAFRMEYELRVGAELVATLRFKSSFGSTATGESADGRWTFQRDGFWQTHIKIRAAGSETDLATFKPNTWSNGGTLEFPDGRQWQISTNFWQSRYDLTTETGENLLSYTQMGGMFHLSAVVEIGPQSIDLPELPWLVMLGWYLAVLLHQDSAAVVSAAGAASAASM